ncbi:MAG: dTMP kinase [Chloroflexi bacterium]|jgi:dTMP kinase|nr:dTMP kinase [Chloroflexota bacterium]
MFITLEGPEGSGKTSHVPYLVETLREKGYTVFPTREPGGTSIGEQVREVLHSLKNTEMHPRTETLLYQAARAQFVEQVVRPRLALGEIVLSDRYADSTIAYQGYGHQQDLEQVRALVKYATGGLVPDLTVLLDVDVEVGIGRKTKSKEWNRMDAYTLEFHQRVRAGYLEMVKQEPKRWVVVEAGKGWQDVQEKLRETIINRIIKA